MDSQQKELLGRNWLASMLIRAGLEVAIPERDRGIDLIAYRDLDEFLAFPIQMKSATDESFGVERKYEKFPRLILAYVWYLRDLTETKCFALTYEEAIGVADKMGYTKTPSWRIGSYDTTRPSKRLKALLAPYEMNSDETWSSKLNSSHS